MITVEALQDILSDLNSMESAFNGFLKSRRRPTKEHKSWQSSANNNKQQKYFSLDSSDHNCNQNQNQNQNSGSSGGDLQPEDKLNDNSKIHMETAARNDLPLTLLTKYWHFINDLLVLISKNLDLVFGDIPSFEHQYQHQQHQQHQYQHQHRNQHSQNNKDAENQKQAVRRFCRQNHLVVKILTSFYKLLDELSKNLEDRDKYSTVRRHSNDKTSSLSTASPASTLTSTLMSTSASTPAPTLSLPTSESEYVPSIEYKMTIFRLIKADNFQLLHNLLLIFFKNNAEFNKITITTTESTSNSHIASSNSTRMRLNHYNSSNRASVHRKLNKKVSGLELRSKSPLFAPSANTHSSTTSSSSENKLTLENFKPLYNDLNIDILILKILDLLLQEKLFPIDDVQYHNKAPHQFSIFSNVYNSMYKALFKGSNAKNLKLVDLLIWKIVYCHKLITLDSDSDNNNETTRNEGTKYLNINNNGTNTKTPIKEQDPNNYQDNTSGAIRSNIVIRGLQLGRKVNIPQLMDTNNYESKSTGSDRQEQTEDRKKALTQKIVTKLGKGIENSIETKTKSAQKPIIQVLNHQLTLPIPLPLVLPLSLSFQLPLQQHQQIPNESTSSIRYLCEEFISVCRTFVALLIKQSINDRSYRVGGIILNKLAFTISKSKTLDANYKIAYQNCLIDRLAADVFADEPSSDVFGTNRNEDQCTLDQKTPIFSRNRDSNQWQRSTNATFVSTLLKFKNYLSSKLIDFEKFDDINKFDYLASIKHLYSENDNSLIDKLIVLMQKVFAMFQLNNTVDAEIHINYYDLISDERATKQKQIMKLNKLVSLAFGIKFHLENISEPNSVDSSLLNDGESFGNGNVLIDHLFVNYTWQELMDAILFIEILTASGKRDTESFCQTIHDQLFELKKALIVDLLLWKKSQSDGIEEKQPHRNTEEFEHSANIHMTRKIEEKPVDFFEIDEASNFSSNTTSLFSSKQLVRKVKSKETLAALSASHLSKRSLRPMRSLPNLAISAHNSNTPAETPVNTDSRYKYNLDDVFQSTVNTTVLPVLQVAMLISKFLNQDIFSLADPKENDFFYCAIYVHYNELFQVFFILFIRYWVAAGATSDKDDVSLIMKFIESAFAITLRKVQAFFRAIKAIKSSSSVSFVSLRKYFKIFSTEILRIPFDEAQKIKVTKIKKYQNGSRYFNEKLARKLRSFVCETKVLNLLSGDWVRDVENPEIHYFIILSPNQQYLLFRKFRKIAKTENADVLFNDLRSIPAGSSAAALLKNSDKKRSSVASSVSVWSNHGVEQDQNYQDIETVTESDLYSSVKPTMLDQTIIKKCSRISVGELQSVDIAPFHNNNSDHSNIKSQLILKLHSKLQNSRSRSISKLVIWDKQGKIALQFLCDLEEKSATWHDGLNLLIRSYTYARSSNAKRLSFLSPIEAGGDFINETAVENDEDEPPFDEEFINCLSSTTKQHLTMLYRVRKSVQYCSLNRLSRCSILQDPRNGQEQMNETFFEDDNSIAADTVMAKHHESFRDAGAQLCGQYAEANPDAHVDNGQEIDYLHAASDDIQEQCRQAGGGKRLLNFDNDADLYNRETLLNLTNGFYYA